MRWLVAAVLAAGVSAPTADAATKANPGVPGGWLGAVSGGEMASRPYLLDREFSLMARSGATTTRTTFEWHLAQPAPGAPFSFATTDPTVLSAARAGVTVVPVVVGAPAWASDDAIRDDFVLTPRNPADYAAYLTALIARYGPQGSLWAENPGIAPRPIRAWQIWNEPNLSRYWRGPNWQGGYVDLLRAAHEAIRAADPRAKVVLAGLPNFSWLALRELYEIGANRWFDVVAVHPYTLKPENVVKIVEANRDVMRERRDTSAHLWVTELSWPAALGITPNFGINVDEAGQSRLLAATLRLLAKERRRLGLQRVFWYAWLSTDAGTADPFAYAGLRRLRPDGSVRSAGSYTTFRKVAKDIGAR